MANIQEKAEYIRRVFSHLASTRRTKIVLSDLNNHGIYLDRSSVSRFAKGGKIFKADISKIYDVLLKFKIIEEDELSAELNISKHLTKRFCTECVPNTTEVSRYVGEYKIYRHAWMFGNSREYIIIGDLKIEPLKTEIHVSERINALTPAPSYIGPAGTEILEVHDGVLFEADSGIYALLTGSNVKAFMFMSFKSHIWHNNNIPRVLRGTLTSSLDDGEVYVHKFEAVRTNNINEIDSGIYKRKQILEKLNYDPYY